MDYQKKLQRWRERSEKMKQLRGQGWSFAEIGRRFGVSRQRAREVVRRDGRDPS